MSSNLTFLENIETEVLPRIESPEQSLCKSLNRPFSDSISGSRSILNEIQYEHDMSIEEPEIPILGTGYESRFGKKSSAYIEASEDYEVLAKIPKYSFNPEEHYYLIYRKKDSNKLDYEERCSYTHKTETFGFKNNNSFIDKFKVGDTISKGQRIKSSVAMDEYGNRLDGLNVQVLYCGIDGIN